MTQQPGKRRCETPPSAGDQLITKVDALHAKWLGEPEYRAADDALEDEFALIEHGRRSADCRLEAGGTTDPARTAGILPATSKPPRLVR